jgi:peptidyl-prolyl cis-trans isomerase B (cyclophilin B)
MKKLISLPLLILLFNFQLLSAQASPVPPAGTNVIIETDFGNITLLLYNQTPIHRDNFLKLVRQGFYNNQIFHRVIKDFMIQAGDPNSKNAARGELIGQAGTGYVLPPEFSPELYHKYGALAAARKGDDVNPQKYSNGSQFYIVKGEVFSESDLKDMVSAGIHAPFTPQQIADYTTKGGTPHLDGSYTVFGEVTSGMDVVEKIINLPVDAFDRPLQDVHFKMSIVNNH